MFNNKEVQVLVSGAEIPVDVEDLKSHTNYTGNFDCIHNFDLSLVHTIIILYMCLFPRWL